jgi:hypothetical protein
LVTDNLKIKISQQGCDSLNMAYLKNGFNVKLDLNKSKSALFEVHSSRFNSILLRLFSELDLNLADELTVYPISII